MEALMHDLGGVVDQLNPLSRQNQIVYLAWLGAYVFVTGAVWRCGRPWARLGFLILLQFLSAGFFVSQANILILAIYLWRESLGVGIGAIALAIWAFRTRRRRPAVVTAGSGASGPEPDRNLPAGPAIPALAAVSSRGTGRERASEFGH
jgi:hypothetical protein